MDYKVWTIEYEQCTPMGLSSTRIYNEHVTAKTDRGAMSEFKRNHPGRFSESSAYQILWKRVVETNRYF